MRPRSDGLGLRRSRRSGLSPSTNKRTVALLGALYFVQGIPFGFQTKALKYYLIERGVSFTAIGLAGALSLPWALKPLWAPLVDRFGSRRQWLIPLQSLLVVTLLAAAAVPRETALPTLLALVFVMNLITATQDIAVDGLAVDLLRPGELGAGNAAQVVGYKLGMLASGSLLVMLTPDWAWQLAAMAALVSTGLLASSLGAAERPSGAREASASLAEIVRILARSLRLPGGLVLLGFVATYRLGESISDAMWQPLLQRGFGFAKETLAAWDASFGMPASILGSLLGGVAAVRWSPARAVAALAVARLVPATLELAITLWQPSELAPAVISVTLAEELTGGALTTAMFAFMMSRVDRRISATHFTVLAAVEVLGKSPGSLASGRLADGLGLSGAYTVALVLSLLSLAWLPRIRAVSTSPDSTPTAPSPLPAAARAALHGSSPRRTHTRSPL